VSPLPAVQALASSAGANAKRPRFNAANVQRATPDPAPAATATTVLASDDANVVFANLALPIDGDLPPLTESSSNSPVPPAAAIPDLLSPHTHDVEVRARSLGSCVWCMSLIYCATCRS
jgi:hypothetical protein